jgi:pimeloyl-ACP methyl ester carboxylesterase
MDDVRAVMDAVGSGRAVLFGSSEGGPMCMLFAANLSGAVYRAGYGWLLCPETLGG